MEDNENIENQSDVIVQKLNPILSYKKVLIKHLISTFYYIIFYIILFLVPNYQILQ